MALVYSQQAPSLTMLQARPSSAGGIMNGSQNHQNQYAAQTHRSSRSYGGGTPTGYRGSSVPMQTATYNVAAINQQNMQWQQYANSRSTSAGSVPTMQTFDPSFQYRQQYAVSSGAGYANPYGGPVSPRDDTAAIVRNMGSMQRPQSNQFVPGQANNVTDKYRRANAQAIQANRSQANTLSANYSANQNTGMYQVSQASRSVPNVVSNADMSFQNRVNSDEAFQARRRTAAGTDSRPGSAHSRNGSGESDSSRRSSHSRPSSSHRHRASGSISGPSEGPEQAKPVPVRVSSSDAIKKTITPSPLSRQANFSGDVSEEGQIAAAASSNLSTPAAKQLAALQKNGKTKSKTSRLRRAFSFGSAADFRKAEEETKEPAKLQKQPSEEEAYNAEQARIAQVQEANGLGQSIYGGRFFNSTDNLSISSTASSASIMLRKMGRGMKKSTRSLVGLFRPKSVVGIPAAEPLEPETSQATASMITAEAERVGVTPDPATGTGFPHLERNSLDASRGLPEIPTDRLSSLGSDGPSLVSSGEPDRADILAAVRKGILKRPGSASPSIRPIDIQPELMLPPIPTVTDSPISSAPSTPNDEAHGHRRTGSIAIGNDDYFVNALRNRSDSKSAPGTPQGSKRSATFSPRIIFHDTWPPQEYDRRGDIATCNRLTPLLAQQIKEELNSFKMEMEVHENSKIYTHFF